MVKLCPHAGMMTIAIKNVIHSERIIKPDKNLEKHLASINIDLRVLSYCGCGNKCQPEKQVKVKTWYMNIQEREM